MKHGKRSLRPKGDWVMGYLFSLPAVVFLTVFIAISILYCLYMSFFEWKLFDLGAEKAFVGLANYTRLFSDGVFHIALKNTLVILVSCLMVETVLGFLVALTLWTLRKTLRVVQTTILLPMITSPVIVGLIWRYLYDPQYGMINYILGGIPGLGGTAWLGDERLSLFSVIVVDIWQMTPFTILILYTAMMSINDDLIEAAQVDGAKFWCVVRRIIIPSVMPMASFVILMRTMDLLKVFDTIYVLTRGGPGFSTETLAMYTYKVGFSQYEMGYAMALSIVTLLIVLLFSSFYIRRNKQV